MKISLTERWIISNQLEILGILNPDAKTYYEQIKTIIENGYEYLYEHCTQYMNSDDQIFSEEDSELAIDILDMFSAITRSLEIMEDKSGININRLKFQGFDGNEEGNYYSFVKFFCSEFDGGRFREIGSGDDNFNSHSPVLGKYQRMLEVWKRCSDKHNPSKAELIEIQNASVHPQNRE